MPCANHLQRLFYYLTISYRKSQSQIIEKYFRSKNCQIEERSVLLLLECQQSLTSFFIKHNKILGFYTLQYLHQRASSRLPHELD